jgi:hypothetical protein
MVVVLLLVEHQPLNLEEQGVEVHQVREVVRLIMVEAEEEVVVNQAEHQFMVGEAVVAVQVGRVYNQAELLFMQVVVVQAERQGLIME